MTHARPRALPPIATLRAYGYADPMLLGGRYQRGAKVGADWLGTIFQGRDTQADAPVTLHYLDQSASDAVLQGLVERDHESRWTALPCVARLLGYTRDEVGSRPVLVREPIPGQPLTETFHNGVVSIGHALWLGERLLGALAELHKAGHVHGALCPDVVYVEPIKWNLRIVQPLPERTDINIPQEEDCRQLPYIAPEVAKDAASARVESDLYSAAAILYRALAGRTHLPGKSISTLFSAMFSGRFTTLREAAPHVSPELAAIIEDGLRPLQQRHRTAKDFRFALAHQREQPPI